MRWCKMAAAFAAVLMFAGLAAGCGSRPEKEADRQNDILVSGEQAGGQNGNEVPNGTIGRNNDIVAPDEQTNVQDDDLDLNDTDDTAEDRESVKQEAEKYVVVLDPGHGGSFSGAVSGTFVEKDLTLRIGLKIREYINDNYPDVTVYMTRENDTELSTDVVEDIELRCEYAKSVGADILVSLHLNASNEHTSYGANMYISHMENVQEESKLLAAYILSEITSLGIADCGIHTRNSSDHFDDSGSPLDYYAINRHCAARDIPGIIVEHCFIDNEGDQSYIASDEALNRLAAADAKGIVEYLFSGN